MDTRDNLCAWRLLLRLAKTQNLTRAAIEENIELSAASRLLKDLEKDLGVSLLARGTRPLKVRHEVLEHLPLLSSFLEQSMTLVQTVMSLSDEEVKERPFRVSIPANIPRRRVIGMISEFAEQAPGWKVEVTGSADHLDILEGRIEAAYLPYAPEGEEFRVIPVARSTTFMVASPGYFRRASTPKGPEDLGRHTLILRNGPFYPATDRLIGPRSVFTLNTGVEQPLPPEQWVSAVESVDYDTLGKDMDELPMRVRRHMPVLKHFTGDTLSCIQAALDGVGIACDLSIGTLEPYLTSGELVVVMPEWHRPLWHTSLVSLDRIWADPLVVKFLTHFTRREQRESQCWKRAFRSRGLDPDAIEQRNL